MKAICNLDVPVDSKAPKPSLQTEEKKETQSSSAKDKSPSHPSPPTPVVDEMHKEAHQLHSKSASAHDVSADFTAESDPKNSAP
ncbi:hypothetical protein Tco_0325305, partial [Tanacetum coccineum]